MLVCDKRLLLEPSLLIPNSVPVGSVRINNDSEFSRNLLIANLWTQSYAHHALVGPDSVAGGNQSFDSYSAVIDASGEYIRVNAGDVGITDTWTMTFVFQSKYTYGGGYPRLFQRDGDNAQFYRNNTDLSLNWMSANYTVNTNIWDGRLHVISAAVADIGTGSINKRRVVIDGKTEIYVASDVQASAVYSSSSWVQVGNRSAGDRYNGGGNIAFFVHKEFMSEEKQQRFTRDVFSVLRVA